MTIKCSIAVVAWCALRFWCTVCTGRRLLKRDTGIMNDFNGSHARDFIRS
jgi:hypothetical protein